MGHWRQDPTLRGTVYPRSKQPDEIRRVKGTVRLKYNSARRKPCFRRTSVKQSHEPSIYSGFERRSGRPWVNKYLDCYTRLNRTILTVIMLFLERQHLPFSCPQDQPVFKVIDSQLSVTGPTSELRGPLNYSRDPFQDKVIRKDRSEPFRQLLKSKTPKTHCVQAKNCQFFVTSKTRTIAVSSNGS